MEFVEIMYTYFRGERVEAMFYILPSGMLLLGLATTALVSHRDAFGWGMAHGLGVALIACGTVGFFIDGFAERRSPPYTAALESLAKQHGVEPGRASP